MVFWSGIILVICVLVLSIIALKRAIEWSPPEMPPSLPTPMWRWTTQLTNKRKPIRQRGLPYGAYGTDIRGKRARR